MPPKQYAAKQVEGSKQSLSWEDFLEELYRWTQNKAVSFYKAYEAAWALSSDTDSIAGTVHLPSGAVCLKLSLQKPRFTPIDS